jgi:hypothetical protein
MLITAIGIRALREQNARGLAQRRSGRAQVAGT